MYSMYLFRNPRLYFDCIKWMIIVLSLYYGLWLTNFLSVSLEVCILLLIIVNIKMSTRAYMYDRM